MALIASTREHLGSDELFGFAVDPDGRLRAVDPVFVRLSGFGPGDPVDAMRHPDVPLAVLRAPFATEPGRLICGSWPMTGPGSGRWSSRRRRMRGGSRRLQAAGPRARRRAGEDVQERLAAYATMTVITEVAARDPRANELLDAQARRLAGYHGLSEGLRRKSAFVVELAESIRLFSLNAILAAHRVRDWRPRSGPSPG